MSADTGRENAHGLPLRFRLPALAVFAIAGIAIAGWWSDHAALAAWLPGIANMTFNTALCFMLVALACGLPERRLRNPDMIKRAIGMMVGLFAMLSLAQDLFAVDLGIDNLFFDTAARDVSSPHPGRMSPNTATGFIASGLILLLLSARRPCSPMLTHALILTVAIVSLLGIGMNVLISDVPEHFAHFASISLFTALSFLLLSISFLGVFLQQQRDDETHPVLYSGIRLMYRLRYPAKFFLISLVMLVPLSILMWNELELLEQRAAQAKLKIVGIEHIQQTSRLVKAVPEHRGMVNAHLADPALFGATLQQKTDEIDRLFASNDRMDRRQAAFIRIPDEWPQIEQRWAELKSNHQDPKRSWRMHTEIIALLGKHLRDIGSMTLLSYDSDPLIHNLMAAELEILPQLFEQVGQLRGQGSAFIARRHISSDKQLLLGAMASQISLLLRESEQLIRQALRERENRELQQLADRFSHSIRAFLNDTEQQLLSGNDAVSMSPEAFFSAATRALTDGYAFSQANLKYVRQLLEQRINDSITAQYTIKLSAMLVILLILYLFAAFYQSVMNTIRALGNAAEQMQKGDVDALETLPVNDEMGDIVGSFNAIAGELMRVSSHMSAVVNHAVDGIITIDPQGKLKSFNPAAERIFGYSRDEVLERNVEMLMPERYRARHRAGLQRYGESGAGAVMGRPIDVFGLRKNGDEFPMELSINAMRIDGHQLFIGMVRDSSEHQELENQLRHAQKMEAVGALVGGVAHNFNNLLAGIVGKTYLAKRKAADRPEVLSYLESIESISGQAAEMIKQLLTFAHKDFFRDQQDLPLAVLVKEAFKTARLGIAEDIRLDLQLIDPDIYVHCDAVQLQQVLMNMMNNARDAVQQSVDKQISVRLERCRPGEEFFRRHEGLKSGDYACLSISDSGHGMDAETLERVFDPFYTTKEVGKGTGLGLSTAFGTITAHHGVIEVESEPGAGATFRIYLPVVEADAVVDSGRELGEPLPSQHHETLLLVDDEPLLRHAITEVLEELGYRVLRASNGRQGLARFRKHQGEIAAVITDVTMPEMSGVEMFRAIRELSPSMPVMFMTGYDQGKVQLSADEQRQTVILSKPLQISELSQQIRRMLQP